MAKLTPPLRELFDYKEKHYNGGDPNDRRYVEWYERNFSLYLSTVEPQVLHEVVAYKYYDLLDSQHQLTKPINPSLQPQLMSVVTNAYNVVNYSVQTSELDRISNMLCIGRSDVHQLHDEYNNRSEISF